MTLAAKPLAARLFAPARMLPVGLTMALTMALAFAAAPAIATDTGVVIRFDKGSFTPKEISLPAGQTVTLVIRNLGKTPVEFESRLLHVEKIIPSGKEISVVMKDPKPGRYDFFDDFHPGAGHGAIVVK